MSVTRRQLLGGLAAAALAQQPPAARPPVCLFSKHLPKLHYSELGGALSGMGFDGCDLTVRPEGHVLPERAPADLLRAIEGIRGEGVQVPMITTGFLSAAEPWARSVIGIAGNLKVPFFKPGYWRYAAGQEIDAALAAAKREIAGLVSLGRTYDIAMGIHNHSGDYVGEAVWDTRSLISDMDPRWVGYYYDPCHATAEGGRGGWLVSLRMALPRIKMVALKDFFWEKDASGKWKMRMCPMGQGMVDWPRIFGLLAKARFTGPLSLHVEYEPANELAAIAQDLAFVRKQVAAAYGS